MEGRERKISLSELGFEGGRKAASKDRKRGKGKYETFYGERDRNRKDLMMCNGTGVLSTITRIVCNGTHICTHVFEYRHLGVCNGTLYLCTGTLWLKE